METQAAATRNRVQEEEVEVVEVAEAEKKAAEDEKKLGDTYQTRLM